MTDVRWGFVGAGNVTEAKASPAGAFTQDGSRVVAVARTDRARAEAYALAHCIDRAYGSVEDLCADPNVDAVYVCTPHHLHREHALLAIRAGKHVLCEKPLAITSEDGLAIVREAERAGVLLAAPYYRRFYPIVEALREVVQSGSAGHHSLGPGGVPRLLPAAARNRDDRSAPRLAYATGDGRRRHVDRHRLAPHRPALLAARGCAGRVSDGRALRGLVRGRGPGQRDDRVPESSRGPPRSKLVLAGAARLARRVRH